VSSAGRRATCARIAQINAFNSMDRSSAPAPSPAASPNPYGALITVIKSGAAARPPRGPQ
jgi:hypothetical protein